MTHGERSTLGWPKGCSALLSQLRLADYQHSRNVLGSKNIGFVLDDDDFVVSIVDQLREAWETAAAQIDA
jgi:hypothetical protein